ncbi:MAG: hypothetical protein WEC34_07350 [Acidimicrobiia bacterium]
MRRARLGRDAVDALLDDASSGSGRSRPVAAPDGYERLAELLGQLRLRRDRVQPDEALVTRMQVAVLDAPGPATLSVARRPGRQRVVVVALASVSALALLGGLGVANALPRPLQAAVSDVLDQFGIDAPSPNADPPLGPAVLTDDAPISSPDADSSTIPTPGASTSGAPTTGTPDDASGENAGAPSTAAPTTPPTAAAPAPAAAPPSPSSDGGNDDHGNGNGHGNDHGNGNGNGGRGRD